MKSESQKISLGEVSKRSHHKKAATASPLSNEELISYWQEHIDEAAEFFFPEIKFTSQQRNGFEELGKLIRAKLKLADGLPLTEEEKEYSKKIGVSIQSGNGTGKDFFAAVCILLFTFLFPDPKNLATANTAKQLKNVLWSEISKAMRRKCRRETPESKYTVMEERLELQAEKLFLKEVKGEGWFTEAVTINTKQTAEEQADAIAGRHEDYQLVVVDEACGIADNVFRKLERTLTRKLNLMLLIFNPTRTGGYANESQNDPRFVALRWNAEDSELVTREHIEAMEDKYGRDSNPFRISVLGLPPITETDAFIPLSWIEEAINATDKMPSDNEPIIASLDCGAGGDKSILLKRKGGYVFPLQRKSTPESTDLIGWGFNNTDDSDVLIVDKKGVGWAVFGRLHELRGKDKITKPYDGSMTSSNKNRWHNVRDEAHSVLRDRFESRTISIPDDKDLIFMLMALKGKYDSNGAIHIIEKAKVKKILGKSSDETDALAMSLYVKDKNFQYLVSGVKPEKKKTTAYENTAQGEAAWMNM